MEVRDGLTSRAPGDKPSTFGGGSGSPTKHRLSFGDASLLHVRSCCVSDAPSLSVGYGTDSARRARRVRRVDGAEEGERQRGRAAPRRLL